MCIRLQNKHIALAICLILAQNVLYARGTHASAMSHYIGIAVGGGEANNVNKNMHPLAGAAGNITLFYEMQKSRLSVSVGLQAQYQYTRDTIAPFTNSFAREDIMGDVNYQYVYSNWLDKQTDIRMAIPVRVGYQFNDYVYILVGADLSFSIHSNYTASADMFTQGLHAWDSKPIRTDDLTDFSANLGYYKSAEYSTSAQYKENIWIAPAIECGSYIPLKSKKSKLRAGAYLNYGIRLGKRQNLDVVDYSAIDMSANPNSQSQSFLQSNIVLNNAQSTNLMASLPANLEVGLRITYLINVTAEKKICMCVPY